MNAATEQTRRWRPVIFGGTLSAVLAVVVGAILIAVADPVFRASTNVSIRPRIADLGAAEAAARLVRNYATWVDSEAYAKRLGAESRGGLSNAEVVNKVRTKGDSNALVVAIQADDENPDRAASLVNGLAEALVAEIASPERLDDPEKGLEISIIDAARTPDHSVWPRAEVILPVGAIIGAAVGTVVTWLFSPLANRERVWSDT
jgi:capsular polysaccharide biosynthesis protein